ncbi:MAG TPA: glycosyltransferase, partial [Thermoleophilaceae bacterium]|nr:glycosyltransferase [Thermoleophilaceae bacterium]
YEYHAAMLEPWDGPAAMVFTDGRQIGATLDRNGLRPARYIVTDDDLVVMASESGVLPIPENKIIKKWRLQPGKMFLIDFDQGRIVDDEELKNQFASAKPYRQWIESVRGDAIRAGRGRFRYVVVSMSLDPELRPLVEWHRIPWLRWGSFRLRWILFFGLGAYRVARVGADLVHTVGPTPVIPNRADLNTVTFCHAAFRTATAGKSVKGSSSTVGWRLGQRAALALERWWFRRVRALGALSLDGAEDLRRHYPDAQVVLTPRGIDTRRFRPDPAGRNTMRSEQGLEPDAVVALFVDQEHRPLKGLGLAIEGFALAARTGRGPDLLFVLGAGNERQAALAERLGVGARVRFLGYRLDVERVYQSADIFVLPTAYETFCRAAYEAAASGLPVVAPPVSGIRRLIGQDEAGIVVRREPADIARALEALAGDPRRRARMGEVARSRTLAFDRGTAAARIVALHESLLDSHGVRDR